MCFLVLQSFLGIDVMNSHFFWLQLSTIDTLSVPFKVRLTEEPTSRVLLELSTDATRGTVEPSTLEYSSFDWEQFKEVTFTPTPFASPKGDSFAVAVKASAADSSFNSVQTSLTVRDMKGNSLAYPRLLNSLPFSDTSSTDGFNDKFFQACGSGVPGGGRVSSWGGSFGVAPTSLLYLCQGSLSSLGIPIKCRNLN
jgi:hypothetical protein